MYLLLSLHCTTNLFIIIKVSLDRRANDDDDDEYTKCFLVKETWPLFRLSVVKANFVLVNRIG